MVKENSIIFFGTSEFAVASLDKLLSEGINVKAVVTVPDKPAGRGKKLQASPVKVFASGKEIEILQPDELNDKEFIEKLSSFNANLFVVVAFRKLPKEIWNLPELKTINLHASLLPEYRGAAPINWAIINGEKTTGVTTFFINDNIDQGGILFSEKVNIEENETFGELYDRLKLIGAELLVKTVKSVFNGSYSVVEQNNFENTKTLNKAPKIQKSDCKIDWTKDAQSIVNLIRGLSPVPAAYTIFKNEESGEEIYLKIYRACYEISNSINQSGDIITGNQTFMKVCVNNGYVFLTEIQLSGKNKMSIEAFLRGNRFNGSWKAI
jgi:methionyl-tRNA formyltransferase